MDRVALVTGGSRGIGRAIALRLAEDGCAVAVNYASRADAAEEVVDAITEAGGRAIAVGADVSDADAVAAMFAQVTEQLGPVTVLVNNAGIT
ncbi:MAG: SDR family NAD(P)-dependent oxidoreductase, partial [Acidimicrobiia bacterium]